MFASVASFGLEGLQSYPVRVECDVQQKSLPGFDIVGLPDLAVKEAKDRVRSALKNSGFPIPPGKITINLAPADIRKIGSVYDLPICLAILEASGLLALPLKEAAFLGELSLSGEVRPVPGVLPMVLEGSQQGYSQIFLPEGNRKEAAVVEGVSIYPVKNLLEIYLHLTEKEKMKPLEQKSLFFQTEENELDFSDVKGQEGAKRALEIAAAGGHNAILVGPPGAGKSMLVKRLPSILPQMSYLESIETTKIYSVAGLLDEAHPFVIKRPFRSPHHSTSPAAMTGGGSYPRPGELSLAHNGVLFLDELPEFSRSVLEVLRQPMEDGAITIARARASVTYPCQTTVVAAMNPCPCGYYGHPTKACTCSAKAVSRYLGKISGPLLDRLDLHIDVAPVAFSDLRQNQGAESSKVICSRIEKAREFQQKRYAGNHFYHNAAIPSRLLDQFCPMEKEASLLIQKAFDRLGLSARAYDKIVKVARTIADLAGAELILREHVAEAIQYRSLDRKYWRP